MQKKPIRQPGISRKEVEQLVVAVVRRELAALVTNMEARKGSRVVKKTVSVQSALWNQSRRECPGPASSHVTGAIRLYLTARQAEQA